MPRTFYTIYKHNPELFSLPSKIKLILNSRNVFTNLLSVKGEVKILLERVRLLLKVKMG
jgi:hypothetical protein